MEQPNRVGRASRPLVNDMQSFLLEVDVSALGRNVGAAFIDSFRELLSDASSISSQTINLATQLLEAVWEQLNVGPWRAIPAEVRQLYSYTSVALAAGHLRNGDESAAILALDKGLILGAPVGDTAVENRLAYFAELIHGEKRVPPDLRPLCDATERTAGATADADAGDVDLGTLSSLGSTYPAVDESTLPSVGEILRRIEASRPLKIYSLLDSWPALKRWNVRRFLQTMGQRTVPVEVGARYTDAEWGQRLMSVETFVREHLTANGYLAQYGLLEQVPSLKHDIIIPDYCYAFSDAEPEVNFWFGGRTVSPLHHDDRHNILCQIFGTKLVLLFGPDESDQLYPFESPLLHNTSQVDVERVDHDAFPRFRHAKGRRVLLGPGDALLIPRGAAGSTLEELLSRPPLDANLEIVERVGNIVTVVRTSVGQLLYLCDLCGVQTEVATRSLKVHLESHYGTEKPFPCKYCNSYASERFDSLKKHFRTHTGEKPYVCPICQFRTVTNSSFHQHFRKEHPDRATPGHKVQPIFDSPTTNVKLN